MAEKKDDRPQKESAADEMLKRPELTCADEQLRLMVESIQDYAIFMLDPEGRVASWNPGAEQVKGYSAEEIFGKHFSLFYPQEDVKAGRPQSDLDMALSHGRVKVEGWRLRKDGSRFWAVSTISAVYDGERTLRGFSEVTCDATERRNSEEALRKSRKMFERLFEGAPDAIVVIDSDGAVRKVNQQVENLFGYMREEVIGNKVEILIPERFHQVHRQHRGSYFADPRIRKMGPASNCSAVTAMAGNFRSTSC